MPAISIDTFFACSLMVLLVLSAMAGASKLLYPHITNTIGENMGERYRETSKYILLNDGTPSNWGQNNQTIPEIFGLAKKNSNNPYELDIDKVSRLNSENVYAFSYAQMFTALKFSDVSLRIKMETFFDVAINLTAVFEASNETTYQFEILSRKYGVSVQTELRCYVIAESYFESYYVFASNGRSNLNITIPNDVDGPALLAVLARSTDDTQIVSFESYSLAHNSTEPQPGGAFLRLSPLNYSLTASFVYPETMLSNAYALTFDYSLTLTQTSISNDSATYDVANFLDFSPTLLIVTGWNSTNFFTEWTAYPQIPLETGADFADSMTLSDVYAYSYIVTINSVLYKCTIWLGGPRN
ncbi:MAG: hypothetical protein OEY22_00050 [Candidatus Bathyarchaeota archaeon]|nr:hypothetical protein [Candidatus Bathyarchaeota archaeon]MDH5786779.1 hypothetical protein [Candidatus Bathyarchaeota archaeon]